MTLKVIISCDSPFCKKTAKVSCAHELPSIDGGDLPQGWSRDDEEYSDYCPCCTVLRGRMKDDEISEGALDELVKCWGCGAEQTVYTLGSNSWQCYRCAADIDLNEKEYDKVGL